MADTSPILDQVALKVLFTRGHEETAEFSTASSIAESLLAGVNEPDVLSAVH